MVFEGAGAGQRYKQHSNVPRKGTAARFTAGDVDTAGGQVALLSGREVVPKEKAPSPIVHSRMFFVAVWGRAGVTGRVTEAASGGAFTWSAEQPRLPASWHLPWCLPSLPATFLPQRVLGPGLMCSLVPSCALFTPIVEGQSARPAWSHAARAKRSSHVGLVVFPSAPKSLLSSWRASDFTKLLRYKPKENEVELLGTLSAFGAPVSKFMSPNLKPDGWGEAALGLAQVHFLKYFSIYLGRWFNWKSLTSFHCFQKLFSPVAEAQANNHAALTSLQIFT